MIEHYRHGDAAWARHDHVGQIGVIAHPYLTHLRHLASLVDVKKIQQRGFRVAPLSLKDFRDITDTRKIIEEQTDHGYLTGEQPVCPICGKETEIWSRVVGYLRPVRDFHQGKKREYADRVKYELPEEAVANRGA